MASQILIGHNLNPADSQGNYGPAFVCTDAGTARSFPSVNAAASYIKGNQLNARAPIWSIFILTEIADGEILQYSSDPYMEFEPVR